ncbi:helix-turn-helix transcriptional regulator, partial [Kitasatospora sp. SUK 42]|uniref:helix-turn-helix domain-containing protein n=1 Tax=Kitasatospora sp. SUK 42 TaxID=1588882 RepID=UPI001C3166B3
MASAWKELPAELSEPARLLAEELRAVKDAAGLSLSELAARTHYSRASWERWLNGKRVVTEQALEALVGAVDCDAAELRRLWRETVEPAESSDGTPDGTPAQPSDGTPGGAPTGEPGGSVPVEDAGPGVPVAEEAAGAAGA